MNADHVEAMVLLAKSHLCARRGVSRLTAGIKHLNRQLIIGGESFMQKRKLGTAGPEVPVLCLGGNVYGWTLSEADAFRQLDAAVEVGLNFVDTADVYSRWSPDIRAASRRRSS